ncbi:MAG: MFS transporter [Caulobacteraceae bacterium]|nr:MFS transporter [Caulobacteraceae bacterium]
MTEPRGGPRAWATLSIYLVLYAVAFLDRQVATLLVAPIKADLHVSDSQIGLFQGFAFVGFYVLFALPLGWLADRFSRRLIVFLGITVWSASVIAAGLSRTFNQLLCARFGIGAGEAALAPAANSALSDLFPRERLSAAMAVFSVGAIVGGGISLVLGGLIVGAANARGPFLAPVIGLVKPWQMVFFAAGVPGLLLGLLIWLAQEPERRGRSADAAKTAGRGFGPALGFVWRGRAFFFTHFAAFSLLNLICGSYTTWAPTYFMRSFGWSQQHAGLVLGLIALICGAFGMLFSGFLADHLFRRGLRDAHFRYYVVAALLLGGAGVVMAIWRDPATAVACTIVVYSIAPFIAVCNAALQLTTPNEHRGQVSSLFLMIYNVVGFGAGPLVISSITDFIFRDESKIGLALALNCAVTAPITALVFAFGCRPMRAAVKRAEAWSAPANAPAPDAASAA